MLHTDEIKSVQKRIKRIKMRKMSTNAKNALTFFNYPDRLTA